MLFGRRTRRVVGALPEEGIPPSVKEAEELLHEVELRLYGGPFGFLQGPAWELVEYWAARKGKNLLNHLDVFMSLVRPLLPEEYPFTDPMEDPPEETQMKHEWNGAIELVVHEILLGDPMKALKKLEPYFYDSEKRVVALDAFAPYEESPRRLVFPTEALEVFRQVVNMVPHLYYRETLSLLVAVPMIADEARGDLCEEILRLMPPDVRAEHEADF